MTQRLLFSSSSTSGPCNAGLRPEVHPATCPGPSRSIDIGCIIIGNCKKIYPRARFNFISQLSDDNVWTVSVTRSVGGIHDVFLEASGNTIDVCFDELLRRSSRAVSHHVNAWGFDFLQEVHIEPEALGESDSEDYDAEVAGAPVNRAEALVIDSEDCGGPADLISLIPARPSSPRWRTPRSRRSTRTRKFAPLASLVSAPSLPPPRSLRPPPPPPPSSAGEKVHYDDPPPPHPPPHMLSSRLASSISEAKVPVKPRAAYLDITLATDLDDYHVFVTEVLPSQQAIEKETLRIINEKQLDSHVFEYEKLKDAARHVSITSVDLGKNPNEYHELVNFGDDLSALFNSCGSTIPRFSIMVHYKPGDSEPTVIPESLVVAPEESAGRKTGHSQSQP